MASGAALRVALVEDDALLRDRVLMPGLLSYGFAVTAMESAGELQGHLDACPVDMVVLDVGLPDGDGFAVARELRRRRAQLGVVMLTGRRTAEDQMRGLNEGADAYLTKPVEIGVLAATLHSLARRMAGHASGSRSRSANWMLEADGWSLGSPCGALIALTGNERRLMKTLFDANGSVVSRDRLLEALSSGEGFVLDPHRLDSVIHRLRSKVSGQAQVSLPLIAVYGEGYVLRTTVGS